MANNFIAPITLSRLQYFNVQRHFRNGFKQIPIIVVFAGNVENFVCFPGTIANSCVFKKVTLDYRLGLFTVCDYSYVNSLHPRVTEECLNPLKAC